MSLKLYHGCSFYDLPSVMNDIKLGPRGFFLTPDINIAKQYGSKIVCFETGNFECLIRTIDKTGDVNEDISSGIEYVLASQKHLVSFYKNLEDVYEV